MSEYDIDVYIIPSSDPHQSEYVPNRWKARSWISGFTGSAGIVVITQDKALLWADGRYHIQAEREIKGSAFELVKWGLEGVPEVGEWIGQHIASHKTIGFDGDVISLSTMRTYLKEAAPKTYKLSLEHDLINAIWQDRPQVPTDSIYVHEMPYAANPVDHKLERVRDKMKNSQADYLIVTTLDDIAWMYNFRGSDIEYSPVALSYAVVGKEKAWLFINPEKVDAVVRAHFEKCGIITKPYEEIKSFLTALPEHCKVSFDSETLSAKLHSALSGSITEIEESNPVALVKSMKTEAEIENIRKSQVRDGVAMVKFHMWLEDAVKRGEASELEVEKKLRHFRSEQERFVSESFHTIAAYGEHAAMMHYSASAQSNSKLEQEGLFLFDSGGNYLDGTTDITRTVALGPVTDEMKMDYTLTLKSHIALAKLRFLHGATGSKIEMVARQPMWAEGLDYKCGTGHGVGYFMNVHEGPQTMKMAPNAVKIQPGMILTNEPGVYREGKHGIRIENTLVVRKDIETAFGQFLNFETVSFCPIDMKPIDSTRLIDEEKQWLNTYHEAVYNKLSPHLSNAEKLWLKAATKAI
jgi:Xaa-Pro aminopeptidase